MTFEDFIKEWQSTSPYITAYTSGSTGVPKHIRLDKGFVRQSACRTNSFFNITSSSRLHSCVAPDFIGGKMMAVRSEIAGGHLTWEEPSNTPLAGVGEDECIDLLAVVPSQMLHIVNNRNRLPHIGAIIIGGSAIHPDLKKKIVESGLNAYETYGMTETASHIALRKVSAETGRFAVLPGIRVGLDDRGCLLICFKSGEIIATNDLATVYGDREFVINGRYDKVIITGGKKVNPFELEQRIGESINCPFIITSEPDEKWGSRVVLKIEGGNQGDDAGIMSRLREILKPWELPKTIVHVSRLPRTPNGKLKRF